MKKPKRYLTMREAAAAAGFSRQRMNQLLLQGRVRGARRAGESGQWVIPLKVYIKPVRMGRPPKK